MGKCGEASPAVHMFERRPLRSFLLTFFYRDSKDFIEVCGFYRINLDDFVEGRPLRSFVISFLSRIKGFYIFKTTWPTSEEKVKLEARGFGHLNRPPPVKI